ncbi:hypothetical protein FVE85_4036 [Porphyridium purpureum]|uniref:Transmembrane protein n=1 Tax=Porphyridium purpureum TaxID=35688 RepID=A0A5J4YRF4_PORPP|nr:hypothetical protein FVE85_4036 [Porphyridium purpureum]|eukprot:POR5952..scf229_5
MRTVLAMSQGMDGGDDNPRSSKNLGLVKAALWGFEAVYVTVMFLSDKSPGNDIFHTTPETWKLALDLSINFWLIMPILTPQLCPVVNPTIEAIFNIIVSWGLLNFCFLSDERGQKVSLIPFVIGSAFLTNVFNIVYLAIRDPNPTPVSVRKGDIEDTKALRVAESRTYPLVLGIVGALSVAWFFVGRPSELGDVSERVKSFVNLVQTDRLTFSFLLDAVVFWAFQGALVKDDMSRRRWKDTRAGWVARTVPYFGLVYYLMVRPSLYDEDRSSV